MSENNNKENNTPHHILSEPKVRILKWAVIIMSLFLVLGFGLVIYKMTQIIANSIQQTSERKISLAELEKQLVSNINTGSREVINISVGDKRMAIQLKNQNGDQEIWIYNLKTKVISNKIMLTK